VFRFPICVASPYVTLVKEAEAATIAKKKGKKRQLPLEEAIVYILSEEEGSGSNLSDSGDDWDELG